MKLVVNRKEFLEAFASAASATNPKSPLEILRFVKLQAGPTNVVTLTGTDGRRFVRVVAPGCTIHAPGKVLLDGDRARVALENLGDDEVAIDASDGKVRIRAGKATLEYTTADPDAFPDPPTLDDDSPGWAIDSTQLWLMADRTASIPDEDVSSKFALGGVILDVSKESISFVATDGRRMAMQSVPNKSGEASKIQASIPPSVLRLATSLFKDPCPVEICFGGPSPDKPHRIHVRGERGEVIGQLMEGRIPPWREHAKPGAPLGTATLEVGELKRAVRVASTAVAEESRGILLEFTDGDLWLSSSAADRGNGRLSVAIEYEGEPTRVTLDHRYLADAVARLSAGTKITLGASGPEGQAVFRHEAYTYIMNPLTPVPVPAAATEEVDISNENVAPPPPPKRRKVAAK